MVYSPEGFTNNNPILPMNPTPVKKLSGRNSLCIFTDIFYVKNKNSICQVRASKSKCRAIKARTTI